MFSLVWFLWNYRALPRLCSVLNPSRQEEPHCIARWSALSVGPPSRRLARTDELSSVQEERLPSFNTSGSFLIASRLRRCFFPTLPKSVYQFTPYHPIDQLSLILSFQHCPIPQCFMSLFMFHLYQPVVFLSLNQLPTRYLLYYSSI